MRENSVVTDGSWGTQLHKKGIKRGECSDFWNITHPDRVEEVARGYVDAGSRIILTNTFQSNRISLGRFNLAERTVEINRKGVQISTKAAGRKAYVFASIGPCGKMLLTGETTEEEIQQTFQEQANAVADAGVDGIIVETMIDIVEAKIAAAAAKQTGLPVITSMVFDSGFNRDTTLMGVTPEDAARELKEVGVDGVGANCGQGIECYIPVCKRLRAATDLAIWIKPNAGLPKVEDEKTIYYTTAGEFAKFVPDLVKAGANFIGSCCGSDPGFVKEIKKIID